MITKDTIEIVADCLVKAGSTFREDQKAAYRVMIDKAYPLIRIFGTCRYKCGAGFKNSQINSVIHDVSGKQDHDRVIGPYIIIAQGVGNPVRCVVQLPVGHGDPVSYHGCPVRMLSDLLLEKKRDRFELYRPECIV